MGPDGFLLSLSPSVATLCQAGHFPTAPFTCLNIGFGAIWDALGCTRHLHRNGRYDPGLQETCAHLHQWQEARQDTRNLLKQEAQAPNTASDKQAEVLV